MANGWIGVDLDGTLAHYDGWKGIDHIGAPIKPMVDRVKQWLAEGQDVRIFTARVATSEGSSRSVLEAEKARAAIDDWCLEHIGTVLPVTNEKDFHMLELWDDRCVQVITNTGKKWNEFMETSIYDGEKNIPDNFGEDRWEVVDGVIKRKEV